MTDAKPKLQPGAPLLFRGSPATFKREISHRENLTRGLQGELEIKYRGKEIRCFWDDVRVIPQRSEEQ